MGALDPRHIDKAGRAANQRAAGEHELGDRLPAPLRDRPRAVGQALAARKQWRNGGMGLETLEFVKRRERRVGIVEMDDKPNRHQILAVMIQE